MEERLHLYEQLMRLPFFQGMGSEDLASIIEQTKFGFCKVKAGDCLYHQDDPCTRLTIQISGRLQMITANDDHAYRVREDLQPSHMIEPVSLFALNQRYAHSYQAVKDSHLIFLEKSEVLRLINQYLIFRLNWLNYLSTQSQKRDNIRWRKAPGDLRHRVTRFFVEHCDRPAGEKEFEIKMNHLASEVNDSRRHVSAVLNALQDEGLLVLHRGRIVIPAMELMLKSGSIN